jgi:hypothetical protein
MTKLQRNMLHIPTREEFHHAYAGEISPRDFNQSRPAGMAIRETVNVLIFNDECRKKINYSNFTNKERNHSL